MPVWYFMVNASIYRCLVLIWAFLGFVLEGATANAENEVVGLTREEVIKWLGDPIVAVPIGKNEELLEYILPPSSKNTLSKNGLIGFGFHLKRGKVISVNARYKREVVPKHPANKDDPLRVFLETINWRALLEEDQKDAYRSLLNVLLRGVSADVIPDGTVVSVDFEVIDHLVSEGVLEKPNNENFYQLEEIREKLAEALNNLTARKDD